MGSFLLIPALVLDKNNSVQADKSFAILEGIVFINSVVVILSYVFGWDVFRSYEDRFGYVGLLIASATGTYFYCVALAYYLLKYNIKAFRKFEFYLIAVSIILFNNILYWTTRPSITFLTSVLYLFSILCRF